MLDVNRSDSKIIESEFLSRMGMEGGALASFVLKRTPAFWSADGQPETPFYKKIMPLAQTGRA